MLEPLVWTGQLGELRHLQISWICCSSGFEPQGCVSRSMGPARPPAALCINLQAGTRSLLHAADHATRASLTAASSTTAHSKVLSKCHPDTPFVMDTFREATPPQPLGQGWPPLSSGASPQHPVHTLCPVNPPVGAEMKVHRCATDRSPKGTRPYAMQRITINLPKRVKYRSLKARF